MVSACRRPSVSSLLVHESVVLAQRAVPESLPRFQGLGPLQARHWLELCPLEQVACSLLSASLVPVCPSRLHMVTGRPPGPRGLPGWPPPAPYLYTPPLRTVIHNFHFQPGSLLNARLLLLVAFFTFPLRCLTTEPSDLNKTLEISLPTRPVSPWGI